jgi:hypothetical protein
MNQMSKLAYFIDVIVGKCGSLLVIKTFVVNVLEEISSLSRLLVQYTT